MVKKIEKVWKNDILRYMTFLQDAFDVVRLVDPKKAKVVTMIQGNAFTIPETPCFSVWDKDARCENCISRKAYITEQHITKIERRGENIFSVVAIPYIIEDRYGKQKMVLELVNKISDEIYSDEAQNNSFKMQMAYYNSQLYTNFSS